MAMAEIVAEVESYQTPRICVTGGEPLAQPRVHDLLNTLVGAGYAVSLETSGALDVSKVHPKVCKVIDLKPPGSGEEGANRYENLEHLTPDDQVKFVIQDEADYSWSVAKMTEFDLMSRCEVLFSPVANAISPVWLAEKILKDRLNVRFQLQLHKILWGDKQGV
ncbi:MAG: hypothetical protein RLZ25_601 [Pseudomonadota bacterium]|jgi:7-carboxy-7-deazaguanine synthase